MKILQINDTCELRGGSEYIFYHTGTGLAAVGHEVSILTGKAASWTTPFRTSVIPTLNFVKHTFRNRREVLTVLNQQSPDLVHIHNLMDPLLVQTIARRYPVVRTIQSHFVTCPRQDRLRPRSRRICTDRAGVACFRECQQLHAPRAVLLTALTLYQARAHQSVRQIIAASNFMKETFIAHGFPKEKIAVLPNFDAKWQPTPPDYAPVDRQILFVGRLHYSKGIFDFVALDQHLPAGIKLHILGGGPEKEDVQQSIGQARFPHRFGWIDWQNPDQLADIYQQYAAVVFPSRWPEPFGIIGVEAMSQARPVVAYDVGGVADWLVDGETGYLVPPGDVPALAAHIQRLLTEPDTAAKMGRNGHRIVGERFTKERYVQALVNLYQNDVFCGNQGQSEAVA